MLTLTEDQKNQYAEDGYIVVPGVLDGEEIERYRARARDFALGKVKLADTSLVVKDARVARGEVTVDDPEKGLWKLLNPHRSDETFDAYQFTPNLVDVVEQLIGPDLVAFLLMFIYKPPGISAAVHPFHQDSFYFYFGPHDSVIGSWVALDRATADNGTLWVIPGSHKMDLLEHTAPTAEAQKGLLYGAEGMDDHPDQRVVEVDAGDGVFFHSRTLHRTGGNVTDGHRRVLTVHFASANCKFTGEPSPAYDFRLVRGQAYEGTISKF